MQGKTSNFEEGGRVMNEIFSIDIDSWKNYVDKIQDVLKTVASDSNCRTVLGDDFCTKVRILNNKITESRHTPYTIVVCGEFKRGKSSLINALLGETIAPVNIVPETVTINTICYGAHRNEAVLKNGKRLLLTDEQIRCESLIELNGEYDNEITQLVLYRPIELLHKVNIIDTPGLNETTKIQDELTRHVVGIADALLYVFVPDSPLSMTEQIFLRTSVLTRTGIDLFLVCNKTDMIETENHEIFKNWMNERIKNILKEVHPYYVSALDAICTQKGKKRPNKELSKQLECEMNNLRNSLKYLIEERSEMAIPNRVNQLIEIVKHDIETALVVMEQGAVMSEKDLEQSEEQVEQECMEYENRKENLKNSICEIIDHAMKNTKDIMESVLEIMKEDVKNLSNFSNEDLTRYYPFFCMDKLQESLELCYAHDISKITEMLLSECGEGATQLLDQNTDIKMKISFHIENQTWTKGDDLGFWNQQVNIGLLTYVIDGIAGALRNKQLQEKKDDVLGKILEQYEDLKEETQESVEITYLKLKDVLCKKIDLYFQSQIFEARERLKDAKEIAVLGSEKKAQIYSSTGYVRGLIRDVF